MKSAIAHCCNLVYILVLWHGCFILPFIFLILHLNLCICEPATSFLRSTSACPFDFIHYYTLATKCKQCCANFHLSVITLMTLVVWCIVIEVTLGKIDNLIRLHSLNIWLPILLWNNWELLTMICFVGMNWSACSKLLLISCIFITLARKHTLHTCFKIRHGKIFAAVSAAY